jgi:hypothetical protein
MNCFLCVGDSVDVCNSRRSVGECLICIAALRDRDQVDTPELCCNTAQYAVNLGKSGRARRRGKRRRRSRTVAGAYRLARRLARQRRRVDWWRRRQAAAAPSAIPAPLSATGGEKVGDEGHGDRDERTVEERDDAAAPE